MEQDPLFAFRILVDIALKALSKAINDPTTAVLAIDQLQRLLRRVGSRNLQNEFITDAAGHLRIVFRTPNWEDFVQLACTEIRHNGGESIQVVRRLRAMLENLNQALPDHRHPALRRELNLLELAIKKAYVFPEDLALACIPTRKGWELPAGGLMCKPDALGFFPAVVGQDAGRCDSFEVLVSCNRSGVGDN